jgi:hypothetical protein
VNERREIRLSVRSLVAVGAAVLLVAVVAIPPSRAFIDDALTRVIDPVGVADQATLESQRAAAERGIARAYLRATEQIRKTRELVLPIPVSQANAIEERVFGELRSVRRAALIALGETYALSGDSLAAYVTQTEARLEREPPDSDAAILLAPTLATIVSRAASLSGPIADRGTREMTSAPTPSPTGR